jgi:hypothetical protein
VKFLGIKGNNEAKGIYSTIKDIREPAGENRNLNEPCVKVDEKVRCKLSETVTANEVAAK